LNITLRTEEKADYNEVIEVVRQAFATMPRSNGTEQDIVRRMRSSEAFVPELSIVALVDRKIVGHILLSKINVIHGQQRTELLSLAPVSVLPGYQRQGVGSQLIVQAHAIAKQLGHMAVVLIGHFEYYPKFGYCRADHYGIRFPFESPLENCMVVELEKGSLRDVYGMVEYPAAFYGD